MGDTVSFTCLLTEESKKEIARILNSRSYYVDVSQNMAFSASNDIIDLVLVNITG